jgi:hypothetical protein
MGRSPGVRARAAPAPVINVPAGSLEAARDRPEAVTGEAWPIVMAYKALAAGEAAGEANEGRVLQKRASIRSMLLVQGLVSSDCAPVDGAFWPRLKGGGVGGSRALPQKGALPQKARGEEYG